jgi:hypothetical protein
MWSYLSLKNASSIGYLKHKKIQMAPQVFNSIRQPESWTITCDSLNTVEARASLSIFLPLRKGVNRVHQAIKLLTQTNQIPLSEDPI